eukprot:391856_1
MEKPLLFIIILYMLPVLSDNVAICKALGPQMEQMEYFNFHDAPPGFDGWNPVDSKGNKGKTNCLYKSDDNKDSQVCISRCIIMQGGCGVNYQQISKKINTTNYWSISILFPVLTWLYPPNQMVKIYTMCGDTEPTKIETLTCNHGNINCLDKDKHYPINEECWNIKSMNITIRGFLKNTLNKVPSVGIDNIYICGSKITPAPTPAPTVAPTEAVQYIIPVNMSVIFDTNPDNKTQSFKCTQYFGTVNRTNATLRSISSTFEKVLHMISRFSDDFTNVKTPLTTLRHQYIDCDFSLKMINITTTFYLHSIQHNETYFLRVLNGNGSFVGNASRLLEDVLGVPVTLHVLNPLENIYIPTGWSTEYFIGIISGSISLIIVILLCMLYSRRRRKKKREKMTTYIHNPLVIAIAIGKYDKHPKNSEVSGYIFNDLNAIDIDIRNIVQFFGGILKYKILPKYNIKRKIKTYWKKKEVINLLKKQGKYLDQAVRKNKHDALIVIVSGHGVQGNIITSDYKRINKDTVHRIFSVDFPSLRYIPGIFIYDMCDGGNDRVRDHSRVLDSNAEGYLMMSGGDRQTTKIYGTDKEIWYKNEPNPDYNLVIINSSNKGFVSQMGVKSGSYMMNKFIQKMQQNIERGNKLFLYEVFHQVQSQLHDKGKQLIEAKYNNKLEYIKFKKNVKQSSKGFSSVVEMNKYVKLDDQ